MTISSSPFTPTVQFAFDKVGFKPHSKQIPVLLCGKRYILVVGGDQSGKSMVASKYFLQRVPEGFGEKAVYWLVAADYERTRKEFEYIRDDMEAMGWLQDCSKRLDPGEILLKDGTRIITKSANDPRTLAMESPHGIIGCEASQLDVMTYERLRGRTAGKRGWLFMSGSYESSLGWYPQLATAWQGGYGEEQSFRMPAWDNPALYPGGRHDPEIERLEAASSDRFFMERIAGIPVPPSGLVFSEFRADFHVRECPYLPELPVYIGVDPGFNHAFAVNAFQIHDGQVRVFDGIYRTDMITDQIVDHLYNNPVRYPWAKQIQRGTADIAVFQHQAMPAVVEVWQRLSPNHLRLTANKVRVDEGTEQMRRFLKPDPLTGRPKLIIDPKCKGLLSEFGFCPNPLDGQIHVYRWKTDRNGNTVGNEPDDIHNDAIKAVIYFLVDRFGFATEVKRRGSRAEVYTSG